MNDNVVIIGAGRTAIGSFSGSLSGIPAATLGAKVIGVLLGRAGVKPEEVDEVILGQVLTAAAGMNAARQAAILAGLPHAVPCMTINKVCGSGLKAVALAAQAIRAGDAEFIVAGGQENMSLAPHALPFSRTGQKMGEWQLVDTMINDGLWDVFNNIHMGVTAENIVRKYQITRQEQDAFAAASQQRTEAAQKAGRFKDEIIPIEIPQKKGEPIAFDSDEFPRHGTTAVTLSKLRPAFDKEGTVTAGNASGINDGAAAVIVTTETRAEGPGRATPLPYRGLCHGRGGSRDHGNGPDPGDTEMPQKGRLECRGSGSHRGQRGLRRASHLSQPRSRMGSREGQCKWGRHRARPSHRRLGCPRVGDAAV